MTKVVDQPANETAATPGDQKEDDIPPEENLAEGQG